MMMNNLSLFFTPKAPTTPAAPVAGPGVTATTEASGFATFFDILKGQILPGQKNVTAVKPITEMPKAEAPFLPGDGLTTPPIAEAPFYPGTETDTASETPTDPVMAALALQLAQIHPGSRPTIPEDKFMPIGIYPEGKVGGPVPAPEFGNFPTENGKGEFVTLPPDLDGMDDPMAPAPGPKPIADYILTEDKSVSAPVDDTTEIAIKLNTLNVGDAAEQATTTPLTPQAQIARGLLEKTIITEDKSYMPTPLPPNKGSEGKIGGPYPAQLPPISDSMPTPAELPNDSLFDLDIQTSHLDRAAALIQQITSNGSVHANAVPQTHLTPSQQQALTQAIAVQLQQLAQNRDTKSLTLQINPPELGKVQVKMTYGRDKSVRADILVEKSDTYTMLQKDSDSLKQALAEAGLQADAGSLNFTLADQGTFQDKLGKASNGSFDKTRGGADTDLAVIEIKSSEEWSVDPKTGLTRYNIYV